MGRLLAVELARQGHRVDIYDAGSPAAESSAATVAAAMLAPLAESAITEPGVVRMGHHGLARWPQLLAALAGEMERLAVRAHWHTPQSPDAFTPGAPGQPDWVLDCRGLGAKADWRALRGVRGEVVRIHAPDVMLQRPTRLVHPRYPIYIAPKEDHLFVIGATEIESDDLSPASVRSTLELLSAVYAVHPGFAEGRILELATQCRPTLPDNLPAIRQPRAGVLEINGLYRHGFMIAPAMLDVTLEVLNAGQSQLSQRFDLALDLEHAPEQPANAAAAALA
jgi:glycine oxidase